MHEGIPSVADRIELERRFGLGLRDLIAETDFNARAYAARNDLSPSEFRALLFVTMAEEGGIRLTAGDLRKKMGLSGAAITYLVERMTAAGHLRRESDPTDRRKVILRHGQLGMEIARDFFSAVAAHSNRAMVGVSDEGLRAAHQTVAAMVLGMKSFRADMPEPRPQGQARSS